MLNTSTTESESPLQPTPLQPTPLQPTQSLLGNHNRQIATSREKIYTKLGGDLSPLTGALMNGILTFISLWALLKQIQLLQSNSSPILNNKPEIIIGASIISAFAVTTSYIELIIYKGCQETPSQHSRKASTENKQSPAFTFSLHLYLAQKLFVAAFAPLVLTQTLTSENEELHIKANTTQTSEPTLSHRDLSTMTILAMAASAILFAALPFTAILREKARAGLMYNKGTITAADIISNPRVLSLLNSCCAITCSLRQAGAPSLLLQLVLEPYIKEKLLFKIIAAVVSLPTVLFVILENLNRIKTQTQKKEADVSTCQCCPTTQKAEKASNAALLSSALMSLCDVINAYATFYTLINLYVGLGADIYTSANKSNNGISPRAFRLITIPFYLMSAFMCLACGVAHTLALAGPSNDPLKANDQNNERRQGRRSKEIVTTDQNKAPLLLNWAGQGHSECERPCCSGRNPSAQNP